MSRASCASKRQLVSLLFDSKVFHASTNLIRSAPGEILAHHHGAESRRHGRRVIIIDPIHTQDKKLIHDPGSTKSSPNVFPIKERILAVPTLVQLTLTKNMPLSRLRMLSWTLLQKVKSQMNKRKPLCVESARTYQRQPTLSPSSN